MRIFSLATDEAIVIGADIVVKVLGIDGDELQLGHRGFGRDDHRVGLGQTNRCGKLPFSQRRSDSFKPS